MDRSADADTALIRWQNSQGCSCVCSEAVFEHTPNEGGAEICMRSSKTSAAPLECLPSHLWHQCFVLLNIAFRNVFAIYKTLIDPPIPARPPFPRQSIKRHLFTRHIKRVSKRAAQEGRGALTLKIRGNHSAALPVRYSQSPAFIQRKVSSGGSSWVDHG